MARMQLLFPVVLSASVLSGCAPFLPFGPINVATARSEPQKRVDTATQALCDVDRMRARADILKRAHVEKFRQVALKISHEVTSEEVADLRRLEASRRSGSASASEIGRRRSELIGEIYTGAILRAGFKPSSVEQAQDSGLSYTVGVDTSSSGTDMYAGIVLGKIVKELGQEGRIAQVSLAASPDQSRYYVELYQFTRNETQPDGSAMPIFNTLSLYDAADLSVPRYCDQVDTALDIQEFNTIPGLDDRSPVVTAPAPVVSSLPAAPQPAPVPTVVPTHVPAPAPVPSTAR